jgi:hypothetical protein
MTPVFPLSSSSFGDYQRYLSMLAGNSAYVPPPLSAFDLLETEILTGSQATVTFSGLNSTYGADYQHLQIRITARSTRNDTDSLFYMQFNGDTGSNYSMHNLRGTGSSLGSSWLSPSYPSGIIVYSGLSGATQTAGSFGANIIDILDPFNSSKNTTTRILNGQAGSFNRISLESGAWLNTNSLTSITFDDVFGNFAQHGRFSLYGLRKASA